MMKKLVTDGRGEFCNRELGEILEASGVQHHVSPPYTPQHNGFAEQANRTIIEMARCMMLNSNMAPEWWGNAVAMAADTNNCLPSLGKSRISPSSIFLKLHPNIAFLRPFGCKTWALKPKPNREAKFNSISWTGTLIGYENNYSAYRILRHKDRKIISNRNVRFDELNYPHCEALKKSHNVDSTPGTALPDFSSNPVLPFADVRDVNDPLAVPSSKEEQHEPPVDDYPESPETGRKWVYVADFQPAKEVTSNITETNIVSGKRARQPACYVATVVDPKSHTMAMKSADAAEWKKAKQKEIQNMIKHNIWEIQPRESSDSPISATWAYC
jgi:hypothetical protein